MWPDDFENWYQEYEDTHTLVVRNRLRIYPVLHAGAERYAEEAGARVRQIGTWLTQFPNHFPDRQTFHRWLPVATWREALRFVLRPEQVERALVGLLAEQSQLLRLRYVDQLSEDDLARVFNWQTGDWRLYDAERARRASLDAYRALCERLPGSSAPPGGTGQGHWRSFARVFPVFPGVRTGD